MKITGQKLENTIHNALRVTEKEGILCPLRFTDKQQEAFDGLTVYHLSSDHIRMAAGITMEFITDSNFFELSYKLINGYRDRLCTFDVYENNNFVKSYVINFATNNDGHIKYTFESKGKNKVVVYLPHTLEVGIESLELEDGAEFEVINKRNKRLLFLGDSITHGMLSSHASGGYAMILSQLLECECLNQGISALCFAEEMIDKNMPFEPDIVIVALGTNDWRRRKSKKEFDECVKRYIDKVAQIHKKAEIFVISPLWRTDWKENVQDMYMFTELYDVLMRICKDYKNIRVINGSDMLHHMRMFFVDGVHPNDLGHTALAMNLYKEIKNLNEAERLK